MAANRKLKLELRAYLKDVTGSGDDLTFNVQAHRTTKAGTHESYELTLKVCRGGVNRILAELHKMHARDRQRIQRELARIEREAAVLTGPPPAIS